MDDLERNSLSNEQYLQEILQPYQIGGREYVSKLILRNVFLWNSADFTPSTFFSV